MSRAVRRSRGFAVLVLFSLVSRAVRRSRGFASTVTACCGQDEGRAAKNKKEATYIEQMPEARIEV